MCLTKITVFDYYDAIHGTTPRQYEDKIKLKQYKVDAWCVGGPDGILAYFYLDDKLCTAHGDDGHWWLIGACNKHWLKEIKKVIASILVKE